MKSKYWMVMLGLAALAIALLTLSHTTMAGSDPLGRDKGIH